MDPAAARRWSPVPLELECLEGDRLEQGRRARAVSRIAGRGVEFDVRILEASDHRLAVQASGPFEVDVRYEAIPLDGATELRASISLRAGRGIVGGLLRRAAEAVLASGALDLALSRFARDAELSLPA
jgi:hypothetical protein